MRAATLALTLWIVGAAAPALAAQALCAHQWMPMAVIPESLPSDVPWTIIRGPAMQRYVEYAENLFGVDFSRATGVLLVRRNGLTAIGIEIDGCVTPSIAYPETLA